MFEPYKPENTVEHSLRVDLEHAKKENKLLQDELYKTNRLLKLSEQRVEALRKTMDAAANKLVGL